MALQVAPAALQRFPKNLKRSASNGDLSTADRHIEMYLTSSTSRVPGRILGSDSISSVCLRIKSPKNGFFAKQNKISHLRLEDEPSSAGLPKASAMQLVVGVSDILFISVSTLSGQTFALAAHKDAKIRSIDYRGSLGSSMHDACEEQVGFLRKDSRDDFCSLDDLEFVKTGQLHVLADRGVKVRSRAGMGGSTVDILVSANQGGHLVDVSSKLVGQGTSTKEQKASIGLLQDTGSTVGPQDKHVLPELHDLVQSVNSALLKGASPKLTEDGSGGTYMIPNADGDSTIGVFKPADEEPCAVNCPRGLAPSLTGEGLKKGTKVGEGAFREVAAYILDHPAEGEEGSSVGFSGVPPTALVRCLHKNFNYRNLDEDIMPLIVDLGIGKLGSLQQFVKAVSNCEDMGPSKFSASEVHKIAILDMRLANTDRNGANILVVKPEGSSKMSLVPIDHGYCLPDKMEDCTFEWLYWPQARVPFDARALHYIQGLDAEEDLALLSEHGWELSSTCARIFRVCTMWLKKGAAAGLTAFEIGMFMVRDFTNNPSGIECMMTEVSSACDPHDDYTYMSMMAKAMDMYLCSINSD